MIIRIIITAILLGLNVYMWIKNVKINKELEHWYGIRERLMIHCKVHTDLRFNKKECVEKMEEIYTILKDGKPSIWD